MTTIRRAGLVDADSIKAIYLAAFPETENKPVAALANELLSVQSQPETFSLVCERGGNVIGHIAFSPITADSDNNLTGYLLAPLAVMPEVHKQGIGSLLVNQGVSIARSAGTEILFVYGDPAYYGRFGFTAEMASHYLPPFELTYPHGWLAVNLKPDITGTGSAKLNCVNPLNRAELW